MIYGAMAALGLVITRIIAPLAQRSGLEPIVIWFIVGGIGLFVPLIVLGRIMLIREFKVQSVSLKWRARLRLNPMSPADLAWTIGALFIIAAGTLLILLLMKLLTGSIEMTPSFLRVEPLGPGRWWILAAWAPFFFANILGEEFLWRGVMLPRQEAAFGKLA